MKTVESTGVFMVGTNTNASKLAGAIAGALRGNSQVELKVIGAGAVNQAVKAVAIARGYTVPAGHDLNIRPSFADATVNGSPRSSMSLVVERTKA